MSPRHPAFRAARRALLRPLTVGLVGVLVLGLGAWSVAREAPGPIHAGNTFGWYYGGGLVYDETFVGPLAPRWKVKGRGLVQNQHGMLTLNTARRGSVSATLERPGRAYGRWEVRLRQRQYERGHTPYRVVTELVPVTDAARGCGERNIALNRFRMGGSQIGFYIRNQPARQYQATIRRGIGQDQWHTYAVEVTRSRISWFVDAAVVRTERRPRALSGAEFQVRFTMKAVKGKRMNRARMQMDWLRYWTLEAPNTRSVRAPRTDRTTYQQAC